MLRERLLFVVWRGIFRVVAQPSCPCCKASPRIQVEGYQPEFLFMLLCFDLDGTLISPYLTNQGSNYHDWNVLAGRRDRLAQLRAEGHTIAIVTNQAGVAFERITEQDFQDKMTAVLSALRLPPHTAVAACFAHPKATNPAYRDPEQIARRKPSGAMIREIIATYPDAAARGVLYIGDMIEDQKTAEDAEVEFRWAWDFFEESITPQWARKNSGLAYFDPEQMTITLRAGPLTEHEINLRECDSAAALLDTVLEITRKSWCTPQILFDLFMAIEESSKAVYGTNAQEVFCRRNQDQPVEWGR
jgi:D-glycero-D-manno-heptose 1,7-bisphosphate phosphatase